MRTINWDILRWSSPTPRGCSLRGRHLRHGPWQTRGVNGKRAISFQGTPPSAETFARTGSLGTSLGGSSPSCVTIQSSRGPGSSAPSSHEGSLTALAMQVNSDFPPSSCGTFVGFATSCWGQLPRNFGPDLESVVRWDHRADKTRYTRRSPSSGRAQASLCLELDRGPRDGAPMHHRPIPLP